MAVYTDIDSATLEQFLRLYETGAPTSFKGIAEGVENSNFLLHTTRGRFILTLFEKRVAAADLPFFVGVMEHVQQRGAPAPKPVRDRNGQACQTLKNRPALIVEFLEGVSADRPNANQCRACGETLARIHEALGDYPHGRRNNLSMDELPALFKAHEAKAAKLDKKLPALIEADLNMLAAIRPVDLPRGIIHADFFPDNALFLGDRLTGAIDFYFACTDFLAYDLAICLNAWCLDDDGVLSKDKLKAMIDGYCSIRALADEEYAALPVLAHGAAMRFFLTRLADWGSHGLALATPKDPVSFARRLEFHRNATSLSDYGITVRAA